MQLHTLADCVFIIGSVAVPSSEGIFAFGGGQGADVLGVLGIVEPFALTPNTVDFLKKEVVQRAQSNHFCVPIVQNFTASCWKFIGRQTLHAGASGDTVEFVAN